MHAAQRLGAAVHPLGAHARAVQRRRDVAHRVRDGHHLRVLRGGRLPRGEDAQQQRRRRRGLEQRVAGQEHGGVRSERALREIGERDREELLLARELRRGGLEDLRGGRQNGPGRPRASQILARHQERPGDVLRVQRLP